MSSKAVFGFFIFILSLNAQAIPTGAVSAGTAGAGRASAEVSDSPFLNPATMAFLRGYYVTSSYNSSSLKSSDLTFSITDAMKDTILPTSLGYSQSTLPYLEGSQVKTQDLRLAVAERAFRAMSFGLALHHKSDRIDNSPEPTSYAQTNGTFAAAIGLTEEMTAGLVFDDFVANSSNVPEALRLKTTTSAGFNYTYKRVIRAKVDVVTGGNNSFSKPTLLTGLETYMNRWLILRVGLGKNYEDAANIFSAGLGFKGPKFGIHYAYTQSQEDQNFTRHTVDLALPIW